MKTNINDKFCLGKIAVIVPLSELKGVISEEAIRFIWLSFCKDIQVETFIHSRTLNSHGIRTWQQLREDLV